MTDKDGDTAAQSFTVHLDGTAASSTPGYSIDGPIVGATVFQDLNFDSVLSSNENYSITDNYGAYNLMAIDTNLDGMTNYLDGRLVSYGGTDSETGLSYNIPFYAPLGSEVISPLTSILEVQIENSLNHDLTQINEHLANVLGLGSTDLQSLNPISAAEQGNVQALTQAAGIMTLSVQLSAALDGMLGTTSDHHVNDIYKAIGDEVMKLSDGSVADFSQTSLLSAIVDNLSSQLGIESSKFDPIMDVLKSSQDALKSSVANLSEGEDVVSAISSVQQVTQGVYAEAITHFYQTDSGQGTVLTAEDINLQSSSSSAPTVTSSSSADDALHTLTSTPTSETSSPAPNPTASPVVTETAAPDTSAPPPVTNPLEDAAKNSSGEM